MSNLWDARSPAARGSTSSCRARRSRPCSGTRRRSAPIASSCGRRSSASGANGPGRAPRRRCARSATACSRSASRPARCALDPRQHRRRVGARRPRRALGGRRLERHLPDRRRRPGRVPVRSTRARTVLFVEDDEQLDKALAVRERLAAAARRSSSSTPRACATSATRRCSRSTACASSAAPRRRRIRASSTSAPPPAGPKTWRSWSTPRARPASPRARCIRTAASSTRSAATTRSSARTRTTSGCASCRCATSPSALGGEYFARLHRLGARTSSRTRRPCPRTCARSRPTVFTAVPRDLGEVLFERDDRGARVRAGCSRRPTRWAIGVGHRVADAVLAGEPVGRGLRLRVLARALARARQRAQADRRAPRALPASPARRRSRRTWCAGTWRSACRWSRSGA